MESTFRGELGFTMITHEHRKEGLSRAYIAAVAAKAGYRIARSEPDYGDDLLIDSVEQVDGRYSFTGHSIYVQAKGTHDVTFEDEHVVYDLRAQNYRDLTRTNVGTPAILVLYVMPQAEENWLSQDEATLGIQHCAYWVSLRGMTDKPNSSTVRISVPRAQVFTPAALTQIMTDWRAGKWP